MPSTQRFFPFILRFWPFWAVWLIVLLLPVSREVFRLYFEDTPLAQGSYYHWSFHTRSDREFNAFRIARANPHDLNARLWRFSNMLGNITEARADFSYDSEIVPGQNYKPHQLLHEAKSIQRDFPQHKWLAILPVRVVALNMVSLVDIKAPRSKTSVSVPAGAYDPSGMPLDLSNAPTLFSSHRAKRLALQIREAAQSEPENAYYPLVEAEIWRLARNPTAMWSTLKRASLCSHYDNHNGEITRSIFAVHQKVRPLILEEKQTLWNKNYLARAEALEAWPANLAQLGRAAKKRGNHRRAVEIGALLASIGDLVERNPGMAKQSQGSDWKRAAWSLAPVAGRKVPRSATYSLNGQSKDFALYALSQGRKDVAALVPKWAAQQSRTQSLLAERSVNESRVEWWRGAGQGILLHALYMAAFWLTANFFLWRGQGQPSLTTARVWPATLVAVLMLVLIWWPIVVLTNNRQTSWTPLSMSREYAAVATLSFCFVGPPFLLALLCAATTFWRQRPQFLRPTRIETELRLSPTNIVLLKWGPTVLFCFSLLCSLGFCFTWLALVAAGVGTFNPLAWLPTDTQVFLAISPVPPEAIMAPLGYCLFLNLIGFVIWFGKWRFYTPSQSRLLTHSGLRLWKESLGMYVIFVSLIYLGIGLCSWPPRAAVNHELERRVNLS